MSGFPSASRTEGPRGEELRGEELQSQELHGIAAALDGDRDALGSWLHRDVEGDIARRHRAAEGLALAALEADLEGPALGPWRRRLRRTSIHYLALEDSLGRAGAVLSGAGVRWMPIKGLDLSDRVYPQREARPTSDIDLLISAADRDRGRAALEGAGWRGLVDGPRQDRYLREEGYAWQARGPSGCLVELHHRLWGAVPENLARELVEGSEPTGPEDYARRPTLEGAYLVAAIHAFTVAPPRGAGLWFDLARISDRASTAGESDSEASGFADRVAALAGRFGVQLPVQLAAAVSARLWNRGPCRRVADLLRADLRPFEARLARAADPESAGLGAVTLARILSGRPTRLGLRRLMRRRWAPPGGVEAAGGEGPWLQRRLEYQWRALGLPWPSAAQSKLQGPNIPPSPSSPRSADR
ncbi:MAG: nucleotidyltransferase family protein [Acidobacteriota bacterium]